MSLLPAGQSLPKELLDDLLDDPRTYLETGPLVLGARRMYHLAAFFALPGLALLVSCLVIGKPDAERIALGIGLLLGSGVWLGWSLLMRGHELVLHADGVEIVSPDGTVWAPWSLFHVDGRPFVPDSDSPRAGLTLPIDPRVVPHVVLRRAGMEVARGRAVRTRSWWFSHYDEVVLSGRYEIAALDIGELLLVLGQRLGKEMPTDPIPPDAHQEEPPPAPRDPSGWITLPLTRLRLPGCCARCAGPYDEMLQLPIRARGDWITGFALGASRGVEVPIPLCTPCKEYIEFRQRRGAAVGMALGAVLGTVVGYILAGWWDQGRDVALWLGGCGGLAFGVMVGSLLGMVLSRKLPVRVRGYSPSRGIVSARFENPEVAARVIATAFPPLPEEGRRM